MPTGLPPNVNNLIYKLNDQIKAAIEYFEIPAANEVTGSFYEAWQDCAVAFRSTSTFLRITFRPLLILLALISRYIYIVLEIIARHTVRNTIIGFKESCYQAKVGVTEFIRFQRSLPRFWIGVELGFCASLIIIYLLRRLIKRRRYVERVKRWYLGKKRIVLRKYNKIVQKISETSITLALLLPHILYVIACIAAKFLMPSVIRYIATKTYVSDIISLWYPIYKTVRFISFKPKQPLVDKTASANNLESKNANNSAVLRSKTKGNVADRWLNATASKRSTTPEAELPKNSKPSKPKSFDYDEEASLLLRYWVVYGFIHSLIRMIYLLPFVGSFISTATTAGVSTSTKYSKSPPVTSKNIWSTLLSLSPFFLLEMKLFFFIWLRCFPSPNSNQSTTKGYKRLHQSSPLQILYSRLAPNALYFVDFSSTIDLQKNSYAVYISSKGKSILDIAVFFKLISESTKQIIVVIVSESATLLPACITLFMPSTFTAYGCVYASAIIPAANSVNCETSINGPSRKKQLLRGTPEHDQAKKDRIRYLKYWVVQSFVLLLMETFFASFLAWVPLSTHMTLLLWIWLNLPFGATRTLYNLLEYELVAFGFLECEKVEDFDVDKTVTVRFLKRIWKALPVAKDVKSGDDHVEKVQNETEIRKNDNTSGGNKEMTIKEVKRMEKSDTLKENKEEYEKNKVKSDKIDIKKTDQDHDAKKNPLLNSKDEISLKAMKNVKKKEENLEQKKDICKTLEVEKDISTKEKIPQRKVSNVATEDVSDDTDENKDADNAAERASSQSLDSEWEAIQNQTTSDGTN